MSVTRENRDRQDRVNADMAYQFDLEICGEVWGIKRTLALVNRVEGRFGAVHPLCERLGRNAVEIRELAFLLSTLIEDVSAHLGPPKRAEIEDWVFRAGTAYVSRQLGFELMLLVAGNDVLQRVIESRHGLGQRKEGPVGPFVKTAASSGATG